MATWNGERWVGSSAAGDFTVRDLVQRAVGSRAVRPRDVRLMGVANLLFSLMCFLFTQGDLLAGYYYPKIAGLSPALVPSGLWFLIDAGGLARGERRHQRALLWGGTSLGIAVGLYFVVRLGGF